MHADWRLFLPCINFPGVIPSAAGAVARWIGPFLTVAAVATGLLAEPMQVGTGPAVRLADEVNPLAGQPLYVDPMSAAMAAAISVVVVLTPWALFAIALVVTLCSRTAVPTAAW